MWVHMFSFQFRLKNSGVLHPIYLVEEHGDCAHSKIDFNSLNQAVANTQVSLGWHLACGQHACVSLRKPCPSPSPSPISPR